MDYLTPAAQDKYHKQYRQNKLIKPSSFEADVEWEASYVDALLTGKALPLPRATYNHAALRRLFRDDPPAPSASARSSLPPGPSSSTAVKEEPRAFRRALSGLSGQVIELDSPPKKTPRTSSPMRIKTEITEKNEPTMAAPVEPSPLPEAAITTSPPLIAPVTAAASTEPSGSHKPDNSTSPAVSCEGDAMDIDSQNGSLHDPMDDLCHEPAGLSQELERFIETHEPSE